MKKKRKNKNYQMDKMTLMKMNIGKKSNNNLIKS